MVNAHGDRAGEDMSEISNGSQDEGAAKYDSPPSEEVAPVIPEGVTPKSGSRRSRRDLEQFRHTRISATWAAVFVAVLFGIALVDFIAQNTHDVRVHFFSVSGRMPGAVALLAAALAGAIVVLAVGVSRVVQLRLNMRRQRRSSANENGALMGDDERQVRRGGEDSPGRP